MRPAPWRPIVRWSTAATAVLIAAACSETSMQPMDGSSAVEVEGPALGTLAMFEEQLRNPGSLPEWGKPQTYYANGSNVRTINGAYSGGFCSVNVGIAFNGQDLVMSCYYNNVLDFLDVDDGSLVGTMTVPGASGLGAMAYDAATGTYWICAIVNSTWPPDWRVFNFDPSTHTVLKSFPPHGGCMDGLAYDGSDGTLYMSDDVESYVHHVDTDGNQIAQYYIRSMLGNAGNSGIATGGPSIFLANNGNSQIYELPKDFSSSTLFASFPRRIEDLECDDRTFAPAHAVIWQQDAYDRIINAFEIPAGACPFGGGGGGPKDTTPPAITGLSLSCANLWPPNHKMVTVATSIGATDDMDSSPTVSVAVASNEPQNGLGDGDTSPDWAITDNGNGTWSVALRAERSGTGTGRVYTVTVTASDDAGNTSTGTAACTVPHDQGKKK